MLKLSFSNIRIDNISAQWGPNTENHFTLPNNVRSQVKVKADFIDVNLLYKYLVIFPLLDNFIGTVSFVHGIPVK